MASAGDLGDFAPLIDLLAGRPCDLELDQAALLLARIEYPHLQADSYTAMLDDMAATVAERAQDLSDGQNFIETLCAYLFGELDFKGNHEDYYNPGNSCLNRVLESRRGIPITLSVVMIEIARRLAKPLFGVALPGHFITRYEDEKYIAFLDPYHQAVIDEARCYELAQMETPDPTILEPVDVRYTVMRMMNNMRGIYFSRQEPEKAIQILDILLAASPDSADEYKQKGVALMRSRRFAEAMAALRKYLELAPEAEDRKNIEENVKHIALWMASRN